MRRKVRIRIAIVVIPMIFLIWINIAHVFEYKAHHELIPTIKKHNGNWFILDPDKISIDKYNYAIILRDVILFPESENFRMKNDAVIVKYSVFSNTVSAQSVGRYFRIGNGDNEIHFLDPKDSLEIPVDSFKTGNFDNANIRFIARYPRLYDIDKTLLNKTRRFEINIKFSPIAESDNYKITATTDIEKLIVLPECNYLEGLTYNWFGKDSTIYKVLNFTNQNPVLGFINHFLYKVVKEIEGVDVEGKYELILNKKHLQDIGLAMRDQISADDVLSNFNYKKERYSFSMNEKYSHSAINDFINFSISNNGEKIAANLKALKKKKRFGKGERRDMKKAISKFLNELLTAKLKNTKYKNTKFIDRDFRPLATAMMKASTGKIDGSIEYDLATNDLHSNIISEFDDHTLEVKGQKTNNLYEAIVKFTDPQQFVNQAAGLYDFNILPLINKIIVNKDSHEYKDIQQIINNIRYNSVNALKAFNYRTEMIDGKTIIAKLSFEPHKLQFKINDIPFLQLLTDERIVKFLKDMPDYEKIPIELKTLAK